ncbi:DNA polymerase III subunit delta [Nordella sp. HKS 07]|uniref:DNA polymerase III subunit delta n=1 Tax=Nordella sp. HKS 07 TaxID=2712222 RepID=UPI0013E1556C|nr:DNA polymerase III subunit delta [Nordella sp. HKS 07]QIG48198.1 DNA polymerase III subunit delta [Nordella sp. HKS 07]
MAILKWTGLDSFLRRDADTAGAVLIYGPDAGTVRERARQLVISIAGSIDDPFAVIRLDDSDLAGDPARLVDETQALSFGGGRRVVWVENAGSAFAKAVPLLVADRPGNLVVAEAGVLAKTAALRSLFEPAAHLWIVPCYEDSEVDLERLIVEELDAKDLATDLEVRQALIDLLGADRRMSRQELAKLALYCHGRTRVTLADVEAVCGDVADLSVDDLLNAVFDGALADADEAFMRLRDSGQSGAGLLAMAANHAARLTRLRVDVERGKSPEMAVRQARPPIFYKQQPVLQRQVALWDGESLLAASEMIGRATRDTRTTILSALNDQITHRAFLSLARLALQHRHNTRN